MDVQAKKRGSKKLIRDSIDLLSNCQDDVSIQVVSSNLDLEQLIEPINVKIASYMLVLKREYTCNSHMDLRFQYKNTCMI